MTEENHPEQERAITKFSTFKGVFIPTLLTILGVIMFLRLGWVVGSVGLGGACVIIILAFAITGVTALSMSSIVTNMQIGSGGAYSIISRSLGLEVGGSIGVPLYLSLALSMAMYIFGFRAGLRVLFPDVSALLVDFAVFGVLFGMVFLSTEFSFRLQYLILAVVAASVASVLAGGIDITPSFEVLDAEGGSSFWVVFAVFFPAATGIMAGANMSGELEHPRRNIPRGTLAAIGVSLGVYLGLAYWLAGAAPRETLLENFTALIDIAWVPEVVLAGLLTATFSSGLNSLVGASRILQAMAEHNVLPLSGWLSKRSTTGEPKHAILVTGLLVAGALLLRELNTIAPLITMFFLITYAMLNVVILIEQQLELVSFRPLLKVPRFVPFLGTLGCLFAMFIINPVFSLVAVIVVAVFYYVLMNRELRRTSSYGDVRSSLFVALAEWAAKKSEGLPRSQERAWQPNLLVPTEQPARVRGSLSLIRDITFPRGSVTLLGINTGSEARLDRQLADMADDLKQDGVHSDYTVVAGDSYAHDVSTAMQTLTRSLFSPNILFTLMPPQDGEDDVRTIVDRASETSMGGMLLAMHPDAGLGWRRTVNLWIPAECLEWIPGRKLPNCDLSILAAYKLHVNWGGKLNIITVVDSQDDVPPARATLEQLVEMARIPASETIVRTGNVEDYLLEAPQADINVFSLPRSFSFEELRHRVDLGSAACLFCRDSTEESVLA